MIETRTLALTLDKDVAPESTRKTWQGELHSRWLPMVSVTNPPLSQSTWKERPKLSPLELLVSFPHLSHGCLGWDLQHKTPRIPLILWSDSKSGRVVVWPLACTSLAGKISQAPSRSCDKFNSQDCPKGSGREVLEQDLSHSQCLTYFRRKVQEFG